MKNIIKNIVIIITILWLVWFSASWLDIVIHNTDCPPDYYSWNLFSILLD